MPRGGLTAFCRNVTMVTGDVSGQLTGQTANGTSDPPSSALADRDRHALLYIVVVLLFYSIGIIVAMVMYLKREKEEIEEDAAYENYVNLRNDPYRAAHRFRVQAMISHLQTLEKAQNEAESAKKAQLLARPGSLKVISETCVEVGGRKGKHSVKIKTPVAVKGIKTSGRSNKAAASRTLSRSRSTSPRAEKQIDHTNKHTVSSAQRLLPSPEVIHSTSLGVSSPTDRSPGDKVVIHVTAV